MQTILNHNYALSNAVTTAQPGGWAALAFKVETAGKTYFLKAYPKARASTAKLTAQAEHYIPIVAWLESHEFQNRIICPIPTINGSYTCQNGAFIFLLFDYIAGTTIGDTELTHAQIVELARIIGCLHKYTAAEVPFNTGPITETYNPAFNFALNNAINDRKKASLGLKHILTANTASLLKLLARTKKLAQLLAASDFPKVLCHTDAHSWNLIQTAKNLVLIDWEGLKLAPPEADLFMFANQPYYPEFMEAYRKQHPGFAINEKALQFYQYCRKLVDIWEFMEQLLYDEQNRAEYEETLACLDNECAAISELLQ